MKIIHFSTITCPMCGHSKTGEMPDDSCQFFTNTKIAAQY